MNNNLKYWLAINTIPNIGPVTIKKMYEHFGSIEKAWRAEKQEMYSIVDIHMPAVRSFVENREKINLDEEIDKVNRAAINIITLEDDNYPYLLKNIYDPPPVLYYQGRIATDNDKTLAVVGTRRASRYGLETAHKLAAELAGQGIKIISGLAEGIDTAAHEGALAGGGETIAIFGCGLDIIFPPENRDLAKRIEKQGALVSEFPLGYKGDRGSYPRRNRIIAGLSLGVIVVEGHYDSGAMITAKLALEQGREVFAVPGNVELEQSKGPHWLIKQGAKLVETVDDVLEELNLPKTQKVERGTQNTEHGNLELLSEEERQVVKVLSAEPEHLDLVAAKTGLPLPQVSALLAMLEMKHYIRQLPGKRFTLF